VHVSSISYMGLTAVDPGVGPNSEYPGEEDPAPGYRPPPDETGAQASFTSLDLDGSRKLSSNEFNLAVRTVLLVSEYIVPDAALSLMFEFIDDDSSAGIAEAELAAFLSVQHAFSPCKARTA
jgi:hypothetical protein